MVTRRAPERLVHSPVLIRDYLLGQGDFPNDTPEEQAVRPSEGDYISRMHRRIKAKIREVAPSYQWPRAHSFKSLVLILERLGLVERTGVREPSEEIIGLDKETGELLDGPRAGELRLDPARGFQERAYFRLTPGAENRIEWADPIGHIALIYPGIRPGPARPLPTRVPPAVLEEAPEEPAPVGEAPAAPRRRARREGAPRATPAPALDIDRLERQRQLLRRMALDTEDFDLVDFQALIEQARAFREGIRAQFTRRRRGNPFPEMATGLILLEQCVSRLEELFPSLVGPKLPTFDRLAWVRNLGSCQAAARVLADAIQVPLAGTVEAEPELEEEEEEKEQVSLEEVQALWNRMATRILGWQQPNSANAETLLDRFEQDVLDLALSQDLEEREVDIFDVRDKLEAYAGLERSEFDSAKEFNEGRANAWQEFLDALSEKDFSTSHEPHG